MSRLGMWFHVALCAVALAFAWTSAHRVAEKKGGPSSVVLLAADAGDVTTVTYRWDKGSTVTTVSGTGAARKAVVQVDRELPPKKPAKKPDPKAADATPPEAIADEPAEPVERETARIPGGKTVLTAIAALEPLKTKRSLGVVDDDRLEAMGLKTPVRSIEIAATARKNLILDIGDASYGAQGRYARIQGQREVHLIDTAIINGLEGGADALLEKRAMTVELEGISGVTITRGDASATFVHVDKDQASTRFFALASDPGTKKEAAGKLMSTLRNLRGTALASDDAIAKAGAVVVVAKVALGDGPWTIELLERGDAEGHLMRAGGFVYEVTATQARELMDDVDAALAE